MDEASEEALEAEELDDIITEVELEDGEVSLVVEVYQANSAAFALMVTPLVSPSVEKTQTSVPYIVIGKDLSGQRDFPLPSKDLNRRPVKKHAYRYYTTASWHQRCIVHTWECAVESSMTRLPTRLCPINKDLLGAEVVTNTPLFGQI